MGPDTESLIRIGEWALPVGDLATLVGGIGTILALLWAVRTYTVDARARRASQARRVVPGEVEIPTRRMPPGSWADPAGRLLGVGDCYEEVGSGFRKRRLTDQAAHLVLNIATSSDEAFAPVQVFLVSSSGQVLRLPDTSLSPQQGLRLDYYLPPDQLPEDPRIRIVFRDGDGIWWQRETRGPVKRLCSWKVVNDPSPKEVGSLPDPCPAELCVD